MKGINILSLEGCIAAESVEPLIDQLGETSRHVMIVINSRGGWLEETTRLVDAIDAAISRDIMVAFHISGRAEGAALLLAHSSPYLFADSRAIVGNLAIRQDDHYVPALDMRHRVYRDNDGRLTVAEQGWISLGVFLNKPEGLHEGRLVNAEAAESRKLISMVCSFRDSVNLFAAVISDIVGK